MLLDTFILFLSFAFCIAALFFIRGGFVNLFFRPYISKIDGKFNQVTGLHLEASSMLVALQEELKNKKNEEIAILDIAEADLNKYLQQKINEAELLSVEKMNLVSSNLKSERNARFSVAEKELLKKVKNTVSNAIAKKNINSEGDVLPEYDLERMLNSITKRLL
ncbi:MAG: hypothetical protein JJW01_02630 [Alphaproteobacteria bacterium]|nr:hypothetical protein [Rickettsiales bacterium]